MCNQLTPPPPVLYKYLPFGSAKSMLENLSLKFAVRNELNDPFETMPGGYLPLSPEDKSKFKNYCITNPDRMQTIKDYFSEIGININTPEELHQAITSPQNIPTIDYLTEEIYKKLIHRNDWSHFEKLISENYGILCLSESYNNILMWSHYADKHQGIVIGLKTEKFTGLKKVKYEDQRPLIPLHCMTYDTTPSEYEQAILQVLTTKSNDWKYESEWRIFDKLSNLSYIKIKDKEMYLRKPIDASIFDEIYFGAKTSPQNQNEIKDICKKSNINPKFFHLTYDDQTYSFKRLEEIQ